MLDLTTSETVLWLTEDSVIVEEPITPNADGAGGDGGAGNEPFLKVNDRTVYKTREDAVKAFDESGKRITSLSGYEKVLKDLGAPEGADSEYLRGVLTEYIKLATEKTAAASKKPTASEDDKEFEGVDPQVVAQTKRGREWLKANAEKVGLVSQEKYKALEDRLAKIEGGLTQKDQEERDAAIEEGQSNITSWLKEAKVDLSDSEREDLEDLIVAYVNSKPQLTRQWLNGDRSQKAALIRTGYEKFLPVVKPGASPVVKAATTVSTAKTKQNLLRRTPGRLPNDGGTPTGSGDKKPMKIGDPKLRELAMKALEKMDAEHSGAGE